MEGMVSVVLFNGHQQRISAGPVRPPAKKPCGYLFFCLRFFAAGLLLRLLGLILLLWLK